MVSGDIGFGGKYGGGVLRAGKGGGMVSEGQYPCGATDVMSVTVRAAGADQTGGLGGYV